MINRLNNQYQFKHWEFVQILLVLLTRWVGQSVSTQPSSLIGMLFLPPTKNQIGLQEGRDLSVKYHGTNEKSLAPFGTLFFFVSHPYPVFGVCLVGKWFKKKGFVVPLFSYQHPCGYILFKNLSLKRIIYMRCSSTINLTPKSHWIHILHS